MKYDPALDDLDCEDLANLWLKAAVDAGEVRYGTDCVEIMVDDAWMPLGRCDDCGEVYSSWDTGKQKIAASEFVRRRYMEPRNNCWAIRLHEGAIYVVDSGTDD